MTPPLLVVGEVRTALLMNSRPLGRTGVEAMLARLAHGAHVRTAERPVPRAVSADVVEAVDSPVRTGSAAKSRGVGTLLARAKVTGGRVLQASTRGTLVPGGTRRLPWAHYLERLGTVEVIGRARTDDLAKGFPGTRPPDAELAPGAVSDRLLAQVQRSAALDHQPTFRARRTQLRWSAVAVPGSRPGGTFTLFGTTERTLELRLPADGFPDAAEIAALCEDLALHDWLLSVLAEAADRAGGQADTASLHRIRPAVHHLIHLWSPGTDIRAELLAVWEDLEERPGFTRQWQTCVDRIRDSMSLNILEGLTRRPPPTRPQAPAIPQTITNGTHHR
ncbi:SCO2521 family protein [Yinghuangia sp. YIM S09857]|uniref:SCO2521 family protein n=1 Tax=Yinghuangia sp. YIM S09857 TaxID=3436929 RepID=UPI003F5358B5